MNHPFDLELSELESIDLESAVIEAEDESLGNDAAVSMISDYRIES
ncbi:hypothetical protein [Microcoleus sp. AT3-D2]|jgi:hypothetical protein